jgi:membrane protease YdiL (CAAX protease family)
MYWDFALILIMLGVAVPLLGRRRIRHLMEIPDTTKIDRLVLYASTLAFQWLAVGVILWRTSAHSIRPSSLGLAFSRPNLSLTITVVISILLLINQIISINKIASKPAELKGVLAQVALKLFPRDDVERLAFFPLVATVAVCEEIIYRGFAQRVFENWSRSTLVGVLASAILFSFAHLYQGRRGLVSTFTIGVLFGGIRVWTGSLVPTIVAHFVTDLTVGFLAPSRIRAALSANLITVVDPAATTATHAS